MRRVYLRGAFEHSEMGLVHVAGGNLGLLLRHLIGVGTPRGLRGRVVSAVWALIRRLVGLWGRSRAGLGAVSARFAVHNLATALSGLPALHLNTENFCHGLSNTYFIGHGP